jgi:hypothetical protein
VGLTRKERRDLDLVPPEEVRDFIVEHRRFALPLIARKFSVSFVVAMSLLQPFIEKGVVRPHDTDDGVVFDYQKPQSTGEPQTRPRGENAVHARVAEFRKSSQGQEKGAAVPYTGRPKGPSGRPGLDKKRKDLGHQRKGRRGVK